jgi:hypothetical protein
MGDLSTHVGRHHPRDRGDDLAAGGLFDWRAHLTVHPAADLFPLMPQDELQALADDIKTSGLETPIVLWRERSNEDPVLVDGRNRLDALALLGWLGPPRSRALREPLKKYEDRIRCSPLSIGEDEDACWSTLEQYFQIAGGDPYALALSFNVHRRHLTGEQRRELIAKLLKTKPEQSNRAIAKQIKVDDKTVASVRREMERRSEIPNVEARTDSKGRMQPATKPKSTGEIPRFETQSDVDDNLKTEDAAEENEGGDYSGFILAVIANAADKANIAIRNLDHEFSDSEVKEVVEAIDALARKWEGVKRKIRAKEARAI